MLPAVVAGQLKGSVREFLQSAFPIATPYFQESGDQEGARALIDELLERPESLFKGPYLEIKLPFRHASGEPVPLQDPLVLPFRPFRHQQRAFERLCGEAPESTIIATGTGSGKTECFMLPVLDDCLRRREQGIKTIVVYPMNALATDQARRFAREVAKLDTQISVGLFVGGEGQGEKRMGPDQVITDHDTLREHPPDILLTNYKMLDFLLIRHKDQRLWRHNTPGMLRYLVVDELHTFDGAQGTDLACLIRRLRDRLETGPELACVGTSATMGSGGADSLLDYAGEVFGTTFSDGGVIREDRLSPAEYLTEEAEYVVQPEGTERALDPAAYGSAEDYLFHQARLWFERLGPGELPRLNARDSQARADAAVSLAQLLHRHQAFHSLVEGLAELGSLEELAADWVWRYGLPDLTAARKVLVSLASLVSAARVEGGRPMLEVRQQLWLRELKRMVCAIPRSGQESPRLVFSDDLTDETDPLHLPLLHCRECHAAAWGTSIARGDTALKPELQTFYQNWFGRSPQATLLIPLTEGEHRDNGVFYLCSRCTVLHSNAADTCPDCQVTPLIRVWRPDITRLEGQDRDKRVCSHDCPECGAGASLQIMGYQAATLASVMSHQLFATPYNDHHKLIAFSDSVQDAAHRAGYIGANTWRQVTRRAMVQWLGDQPDGLTLRELRDLMPDAWRDRLGRDDRFCGTFIAPNMEWLNDYQHLLRQDKLPEGSDLSQLVAKRLGWECVAEFGRRSRIGRSLERTEQVAVGMDPVRLRKDLEPLHRQLSEEIAALSDLSLEGLADFVTGWLAHLRQIGAIDDPVLASYVHRKGDTYVLSQREGRALWMPGYGRTQPPPAAVTETHVSQNFEALFRSNGDSWTTRWLKKTLAGGDQVMAAAEDRQIMALVLRGLTRSQWLVEHDNGQNSAWLLNPERLRLSLDTVTLRCERCRHAYTASRESLELFEGLYCLRANCHGQMATQDSEKAADATGEPPRRLVPHEHTGLLEEGDRKWVETSFMRDDPEPWNINILSATPTLEMGIDIGDLSSVLLCSVPPAQANYLQRIGRAGRRDGNALTVTVANGQPHDLHFYHEPRQMMAGTVHTPGVFLHALAVLERQLMAYCFDRWAAAGPDASAMPGQLRPVLDAVEHEHRERFPYNFLNFIQQHDQALLDGFLQRFDHLGDEERRYLEAHLRGTGEHSLALRLTGRLQELVKDRREWKRKAEQLKYDRDRLKKLPEDEATKDQLSQVEQERNALLRLMAQVNHRHVLNFLTDEGILPNYAFPEEGVTLRSVILRRRVQQQDQEDGKGYDKLVYEFQRPAQAALSELAPESRFYAVSHRMEVDQVDIRKDDLQEWRFCPSCHYNEDVTSADHHSACPKCGDPQWRDRENQRHTLLRLRQVYATVNDREDRIRDDSEQREPQFFQRQMLVSIPEEGHAGGFRVDDPDLPFGFEFLKKAVLREVNFGDRREEGRTFSVAGEELSRRGFRICRHCGKVQGKSNRNKPLEKRHAFGCSVRRNPERDTEEAYLDSLYLYRELHSEAIRILLPLSDVAYSDVGLHSFIAALNLGLKTYFKGDVRHLEVTDMREPARSSSGERVYLVVYDRIPGGTGYLKELMRDPDKLMGLLAAAREHLIHCECWDDDGRDGCYGCLYAYRNSRNMEQISARHAEALLRSIIAHRGELQPVESLGQINTNVLIESQLEQRFVDALGRLRGARMEQQLVNGKMGSLLTLPGEGERPVAWTLEHQVELGPSDGLPISTWVDVLMRPAREEDARRTPPIAIYTDGWQYHQDRIANDVIKRCALLRSGRYQVWTLNWDDLPEAGTQPKGHEYDVMRRNLRHHAQVENLYERAAAQCGWDQAGVHAGHHDRGSFRWLEAMLRAPIRTRQLLTERAGWRTLTWLVPKLAEHQPSLEAFEAAVLEAVPESLREEYDARTGERMIGGVTAATQQDAAGVQTLTAVSAAAMSGSDLGLIARGMQVVLSFDDTRTGTPDEVRENWRRFWHAANQLQFLPGFLLSSQQAVASGQLEHVCAALAGSPTGAGGTETPPHETDDAEWSAFREYTLLEPDFVDAIAAMDIPVPEVGLDIAAADGAVVIDGADVEAAWADQRVAVVTEMPANPPEEWRLLLADDEALLERFKGLMEEGVL